MATVILFAYPFLPDIKTKIQQIVAAISTTTFSQQESHQAKKTEATPLKRFNLLSSDRGFIHDAAIKMVLSNLVTGTSAYTFKNAYPKFADQQDKYRFSAPPNPHSIYLRVQAQTRLAGLAGFS